MRFVAGYLMVLLTAATLSAQEPPPPNPAKPVNYVAWLNEKFTPKGPNAATEYIAAAKHYVHDEKAIEIIATGFDWDKAQERVMRSWVDKNQECLSRFAAATRIGDCYFASETPEVQDLSDLLFGNLPPIQKMAKVVAARARFRFVEGRTDDAFDDLDLLFRCSRQLRAQPVTIEFLIGRATAAHAHSLLLSLSDLVDDVDYQRALRRVEEIDQAPPSAEFFLTELLMLWDHAQRYLRDEDADGLYERIRMPSSNEPGAEETVLWHRPPETIEQFVQRTRDDIGRWKAIFATGYLDARRLAEEFQDEMKSRLSIESIFSVDLWRTVQLDRRRTALRNAVRIEFALRAYHARHNRWPRSLEIALPGKLAQYRIDPFSGRDFVYRLKDGQPLLYSVGENGRDDGGRKNDKKQWAADGDAIFMEPTSKK